jgi:hypothetical protein
MTDDAEDALRRERREMRSSLHEWDAAYVLGALSPDDRRRFEEHLEECPECRASVADLAVMPALLSRVTPPPPVENGPAEAAPRDVPAVPGAAGVQAPGPERDTAAPIALERAAHGPDGPVLHELAHRVRRRRRARRWALAGAAALAAAAIAAAVVLPTTLNAPAQPATSVALAQTTPSPLSATVGVTAKRWGTELTMSCSYGEYRSGPTGSGSGARDYALYVTDASGEATRVASWSAWPGSTIHASAAVATPKGQLRSLQVRDVATDTVLLSSPVR